MLVSIIMPAYNSASTMDQSIHSVLAQSMKDWELLIIDDCSKDETAQIAKEWCLKDSRIHYHCLEQNGGPAAARNAGIEQAMGRYIAFLDADDLWLPEKLEKQIRFMKKKHAAFSCTGYALMNEKGESLHTALIPPEKTDYSLCIRLSNPIGNLSAMYDQDALGKIYVPMIRKRNDFALWLQVLKKTQYCYGMPDILARYRTGQSQSVSANKLDAARYHYQLYHDIEKHSLPKTWAEIAMWAAVKGLGIGIHKISTDL